MTRAEALEKARRVVLSAHEATDRADADGAQMLDGQWYVPIWGCDTADHLIERFAAALLAAAGGDVPAGDCVDCGGPVYHRPGKPGEFNHVCGEPGPPSGTGGPDEESP